jgi:hypothetical protein
VARSLERGLGELGYEVEVARSDDDFNRKSEHMADYDVIFLDPWTWVRAPTGGEERSRQKHEST